MNKTYFISKEQLEPLVKQYKSVRKILMALGYSGETGGGYTRFYKLIEEYGIDISHWGSSEDRQKWSGGLTRSSGGISWGYTAEQIFTEKSSVATKVVRKYLESEPEFVHKCQCCGLTEWLGKKISLDLDHKNGNNRDNRRENLHFICPNCHAQTDTYRGKNINKSGQKVKVTDEQLLEILMTSPNIRQALMTAGLSAKGGNYTRVYEMIHKHNIEHLK